VTQNARHDTASSTAYVQYTVTRSALWSKGQPQRAHGAVKDKKYSRRNYTVLGLPNNIPPKYKKQQGALSPSPPPLTSVPLVAQTRVVHPPLVAVAEHLIRLGNLPEPAVR